MRDVFGAWNALGIRAIIEDSYSTFGPKSGWQSAGGFILDAFQVFAKIVQHARKDVASDVATEEVLSQIEAELSARSIACEAYAPLFGVTVPTESMVRLPRAVILRAATEDDWNRSHSDGGLGFHHHLPSACLTVGFERSRTDATVNASVPSEAIDSAKRAMSVFMGGRIGSSFVEVRSPAGRLLVGGGFKTLPQGAIPSGAYSLTESDIPKLISVAERLEKPMCNELQFACERLTEAEHRLKARDTILDAVIGLESILLVGDAAREGLRHRFALAAASLLPLEAGPLRRERFRLAYDMYLARSKLAHSGAELEPQKIGAEKLSGAELAKRACSLLRETIHWFLLDHVEVVPTGRAKAEDYWRDFWERRLFGLDAAVHAVEEEEAGAEETGP